MKTALERPIRILHLPDVIGGHPPALAKGERELGLRSETLSCQPSVYEYEADTILGSESDPLLKKVRDRWTSFLNVRNAFDVFHFNFGASLLNFPRYGAIVPELGFYSRDAARFMTWQGDDARLTYPQELDLSLAEEIRRKRWDGPKSARSFVSPMRLLKRRLAISRSASKCNHMFALNPDLLRHLPPEKTSFLPYAIEPPRGAQPSPAALNRPAHRPLKLVHLSTSPVIKGTGLIETAVEKAKREVAIEFDLVVKKPRAYAIERLSKADYLIDQLVLGWYGGTVVEAMYLGVPSIGHIAQAQASAAGELGRDVPVIRAEANTLADVIIHLAHNPDARPQYAKKALAFANAWHRPVKVASVTIEAYERALAGAA